MTPHESGHHRTGKDTTVEQLMAVSNRFERIALAEKDQWLPYYYAAYARSIAGFITTDKSKVDEVLDGAKNSQI